MYYGNRMLHIQHFHVKEVKLCSVLGKNAIKVLARGDSHKCVIVCVSASGYMLIRGRVRAGDWEGNGDER